MTRSRRISSLTVVLLLMASSLILVTAGAAQAATYDPAEEFITLDDAHPSLHYAGVTTAPQAWVWGDSTDIGEWTDVWQLTVDTSAQCDAEVQISWFDWYPTQDVYEVFVDGVSQGVNPAGGTGTADLTLADGTYEIVVDWQYYRTDQPVIAGGSYYDITFDITGCDNWGEITSPDAGDILLAGDTLMLGFDYYDDDYDRARWAVRHNASASCSGGTVVGNVDGRSDTYTWDGATFAAAFDTADWATGDYCFVVNPANESTENQVREVQWFRIADGHINGGGQIIQEIPDEKKPYKVSFGGELWRFGNALECDWTVQFHKVSIEAVSGGAFHGSSCWALNVYDPDIDPTDGVVNFKVDGLFNGQSAMVLFRMEDRTEPAAVGDSIRMELYVNGIKAYDTSNPLVPGGDFDRTDYSNVGSARTPLDRGNLQIDMR